MRVGPVLDNVRVPQQFYRDEPTARTSWRQAILMGVNTRTYKFALGAALLDVAKTGRDAVPLVELASTYATYLVNRAGNYPQASSSLQLSDMDFLSVLARERDESAANNAPTEALVDAATRYLGGPPGYLGGPPGYIAAGRVITVAINGDHGMTNELGDQIPFCDEAAAQKSVCGA